jgi:hypothetical protein
MLHLHIVGEAVHLPQSHVVDKSRLRRSGTFSRLMRRTMGPCKKMGRPFLDYTDLQLNVRF